MAARRKVRETQAAKVKLQSRFRQSLARTTFAPDLGRMQGSLSNLAMPMRWAADLRAAGCTSVLAVDWKPGAPPPVCHLP